mgnify:CR=1 FL=1
MTTQLTITRIKLPLANAYLVQGERPILVDAGAPGDADRIVRALAQKHVRPADLALILLTHGHGDAMARSGCNVLGALNGLEARMIAPFVNKPFPPVAASILLDAPLDLRAYGVAGEVIATPGHTAGSVSIFFDNGDAIVGDLLMGGRMGGALWSSQSRLHYFVADFAQLAKSIVTVLARRPQRLLVGHGGPLAADAVQAWSKANQLARR